MHRLADVCPHPRGAHAVRDGYTRERREIAPAGVGGFHSCGHILEGVVEGGRGASHPLRGDVDGVHPGGADGVETAVHGGEPHRGGGQAGRAAGRVSDDHDTAAAVVDLTFFV